MDSSFFYYYYFNYIIYYGGGGGYKSIGYPLWCKCGNNIFTSDCIQIEKTYEFLTETKALFLWKTLLVTWFVIELLWFINGQ